MSPLSAIPNTMLDRLVRSIILAVVAICVSVHCNAQQFFTTQYTLRDGLSHPNVYRMFSDRQGFLWFCTEYGLSRFDGHAFQNNPHDTAGLLKSSVLSISESATGTKLVCATKDRLLRLAGSSLHALNVPGLDTLVPFYASEQAGRVYLVARDRQVRYRLYEIIGQRLIPRPLLHEGGGEVQCNKLVPAGDDLLLATSSGLHRIAGGRILRLFEAEIDEEVVDVARVSGEDYWVGLKNSVVHLSADGSAQSFSMDKGQEINDLLLDSRNQLWVAVKGGGLLLLRDGIFTDLTPSLDFGRTVVNDMLEDFEGNIWVATYGAGAYKISSLGIVQFPFSAPGQTLYGRALCVQASDRVFIGSLGRVFVGDGCGIKPYPVRSLQLTSFVYFIRIYNGRLLIGTSNGLILKSLTPPFTEKLIKEGTLSICTGRDGRIWVGGYNYVFELRGDSLIRDAASPEPPVRYHALEEDARGNLVCGMFNDVFIRRSGLADYRYDTLLANTGAVNDLLRDRTGRMWIATNNGLICIAGKAVRHYRAPRDLPVAKCVALEEDGAGRLWVGTLRGLSYIDLQTLRIAQFSGLPVDATMSLQSDGEGRLYVGSAGKLIAIHTDDARLFRESIPPLYLTDVRVNGVAQSARKRVALPYDDNKLTVGYVGLSYGNSQSVEYRYRLAPLDDAWHPTQTDKVEFSSLPSGRYRFMLEARVGGGPWGKRVVLPIEVATPVWRQWWFVGSVVLLSVVLLALLTRYLIIRSQKRQRERLSAYNRMVYLRQQALHALINPHFIFNCLNSIQHYLNEHETDKANDYLADFAYLIRTTLEDAQKAFIPLDRELARIELYLSFESLRFGESLHYTIDLDKRLDPRAVSIPNMMLQPFIENAIWHGILPKRAPGTIAVRFRKDGDQLRIFIEDDGVGFRRQSPTFSQDHSSHLGIRLTEQRLAMLGKLTGQAYTLRIHAGCASSLDTGTTVEIVVPLVPDTTDFALHEEAVQSSKDASR